MNLLINRLILTKMKKKILWLFATNYGRYLLSILFLLSGVFSQYGTIELLTTNYVIFDYTPIIGVVLMVAQFIYHVSSAIYLNIKNS